MKKITLIFAALFSLGLSVSLAINIKATEGDPFDNVENQADIGLNIRFALFDQNDEIVEEYDGIDNEIYENYPYINPRLNETDSVVFYFTYVSYLLPKFVATGVNNYCFNYMYDDYSSVGNIGLIFDYDENLYDGCYIRAHNDVLDEDTKLELGSLIYNSKKEYRIINEDSTHTVVSSSSEATDGKLHLKSPVAIYFVKKEIGDIEPNNIHLDAYYLDENLDRIDDEIVNIYYNDYYLQAAFGGFSYLTEGKTNYIVASGTKSKNLGNFLYGATSYPIYSVLRNIYKYELIPYSKIRIDVESSEMYDGLTIAYKESPIGEMQYAKISHFIINLDGISASTIQAITFEDTSINLFGYKNVFLYFTEVNPNTGVNNEQPTKVILGILISSVVVGLLIFVIYKNGKRGKNK